MNVRQDKFEALFNDLDDRVKRIMLLTELKVSRQMFFNMDCRTKARHLRELADALEGLADNLEKANG